MIACFSMNEIPTLKTKMQFLEQKKKNIFKTNRIVGKVFDTSNVPINYISFIEGLSFRFTDKSDIFIILLLSRFSTKPE